MPRLKLATVWLGGCSGCHMSLLDLDEWLIELAARAELVYSPFIDVKEFPSGVDVVLVEGAIANDEHWTMARTARQRSRILVSFGDCAVTGNVTALRNCAGGLPAALGAAYKVSGESLAEPPADATVLPRLLEVVVPLHEVVAVDLFVPGCPPSAAVIRGVLESFLEGKMPVLDGRSSHFGS